MSHFLTFIILPENTTDVSSEVENLLQPFDENTIMPRYIESTREQLVEIIRKQVDSFKSGTYAEYLDNPSKYEAECQNLKHLNYIKNEFPLKLEWTDEECYQEGMKYTNPENIGPNGETYSTYNPNSKWDFWRIGGRWDGTIINNPQSSENGFNFSDEHETVVNNSCLVKDIKDSPFAIVTPDGKWHERGNMGWFGAVNNEKDEDVWERIKTEIFNKYAENLVIACDLHI